jgi:N-acetylmuramoyl-L-alanine amidase
MNKIAVVVGHDKIEQGAYSNLLKQSEFAYHSEVVKHLPFDVYYRDEKLKTYGAKIRDLAKRINAKKYNLVIELHYNSFNGVANGCEALYFRGSKMGQRWAEIYVDRIVNEYGNNPRGAKPKVETDRGGLFLKLIDAPCLILEPFFGDNKEALLFKDHKKYAELLIKTFC